MLDRPKDYPHFCTSVRADVIRCMGKYGFWALCWLIVSDRSFRPLFTLRLCQAACDLPVIVRPLGLWPARIWHYLAQQFAGVDLPWRTRIGPGFHITHGWCLVIGPGATIGCNVTVFHGVTIGQKDLISSDGRKTIHPVIEDEVWIGPHAVIAGGVTVGRGSRIAPGTVVIKNVEPYTIVAGNPGQVIQNNTLPDVVFPAEIVKTEDQITVRFMGGVR